MKSRLVTSSFVVICLGMTTASALAGGREPGSLLLFPFFDSTPGLATLITVTNTNPNEGVWIEYRYIDAYGCVKSDRSEFLTPHDTLTVLASAHNQQASMGYLYVFAKNAVNGTPISFNYLVGQASVADGIQIMLFSYNAYVFDAIPAHGLFTDLDGDQILDLDGKEYEQVGDVIIHPRFIGQASPGYPGFYSSLVMVNLTGGTQFTAEVLFLIYNDNEVQFSQGLSFRCWALIHLDKISGAFKTAFLRSNGDDEDEILGLPILESGWFTVDGVIASSSTTSIEDPAIVTLLMEATSRFFAGSDLPFQDGLQDNGDLLPRSVFGDS